MDVLDSKKYLVIVTDPSERVGDKPARSVEQDPLQRGDLDSYKLAMIKHLESPPNDGFVGRVTRGESTISTLYNVPILLHRSPFDKDRYRIDDMG